MKVNSHLLPNSLRIKRNTLPAITSKTKIDFTTHGRLVNLKSRFFASSTVAELFPEVASSMESVIHINGAGTGFSLGEGLLMTDAHVAERVIKRKSRPAKINDRLNPSKKLACNNGKEFTLFGGKVVYIGGPNPDYSKGSKGSSHLPDIAILHVPSIGSIKAMALSDQKSNPVVSQLTACQNSSLPIVEGNSRSTPHFLIGSPQAMGNGVYCSVGSIHSLKRYDGHGMEFDSDHLVDFGNSGGPLVDEQGKVVAIARMKLGNQHCISTPITDGTLAYEEVGLKRYLS